MMDWAEKIAKRLVSEDGCYVTFMVDGGPLESHRAWEDVALELRQAREDGILIGLDRAHDAIGGQIMALKTTY